MSDFLSRCPWFAKITLFTLHSRRTITTVVARRSHRALCAQESAIEAGGGGGSEIKGEDCERNGSSLEM